jgi:NADH dehydrogenase FAD-containing subunit
VLTNDGFVRVQPTLQLNGHPNIFSGGDVIEWAEQRQEAKAGKHASIIAANVVAYLEGKSLQEYKGSVEMIAITNGRVCAFSFLNVLI